MKKNLTFYLLMSMLVVLSVSLTNCTKEGPAGPAGTNGTNGTDGEDGINGTDGTATCILCHDNSQNLSAKVNQWEASLHATGTAFARNTGECAVCHTSQGFRGNLDGSFDWTAEGAMISNPNPPNCYTCHNVHDTYTTGDWALTASGAVALRNVTETFDFGTGGLCASCHQGRTVAPWPVAGGDDITVTNTRYGVHHGPQANAIAGLGLFEVGTINRTHAHQNVENTCTTCHMGEASGVTTGGHTFMYNSTGCVSCHSDLTSLATNTEELQAEVTAMLAELKLLLDERGITAAGSDNSLAGTYPGVVAGACLNYKALTEDKSFGVHNPTYIKSVLQNSIDALQN